MHDLVSGGDGGGDSGNGRWSSEFGGAPFSMPGTAAPAMVAAPGGVDDVDYAPMVVGGGRGGGERRRRWRSSRRSGRAAGDDGATAAAATTIAMMTTKTTPIAEWERNTHHWTMVRGRGSGGWVTMF